MTLANSLSNKIPVLDKGFVTLLSSSMDSKLFAEVSSQFMNGESVDSRILDANTVHMLVKCPLFVQLSFGDVGLTCFSQRQSYIEIYSPTVNEIGAKTLKDSEDIAEHMKQTSDALIVNSQTYKMDGCDTFISQINSPISVYNVLLVTGTLSQYVKYCSKKNLPRSIEAYRAAIKDILLANWNSLWSVVGDKDEETKKAPNRKRARD